MTTPLPPALDLWFKQVDARLSALEGGVAPPPPGTVQPASPTSLLQARTNLLLNTSFGTNAGRMNLAGIQANFLPHFANGDITLGGNAECEIYATDWSNHIVNATNLQLKAHNTRAIVGQTAYNSADIGAISSAMLSTPALYKGGYFELRCQQPPGRGSFPAFWTDISNFVPGRTSGATWPPEVDFFEIFNSFGSANGGDYSSWNMHVNAITGYGYPNTVTVLTDLTHAGGFYGPGIDLSAGMHIYGVEWILGDPRGDRWRIYFDGLLVKDFIYPWVWVDNTAAPGGYIIVNLAYNPSWMVGIDPAQFPAYMTIDYLRIWQ